MHVFEGEGGCAGTGMTRLDDVEEFGVGEGDPYCVVVCVAPGFDPCGAKVACWIAFYAPSVSNAL